MRGGVCLAGGGAGLQSACSSAAHCLDGLCGALFRCVAARSCASGWCDGVCLLPGGAVGCDSGVCVDGLCAPAGAANVTDAACSAVFGPRSHAVRGRCEAPGAGTAGLSDSAQAGCVVDEHCLGVCVNARCRDYRLCDAGDCGGACPRAPWVCDSGVCAPSGGCALRGSADVTPAACAAALGSGTSYSAEDGRCLARGHAGGVGKVDSDGCSAGADCLSGSCEDAQCAPADWYARILPNPAFVLWNLAVNVSGPLAARYGLVPLHDGAARQALDQTVCTTATANQSGVVVFDPDVVGFYAAGANASDGVYTTRVLRLRVGYYAHCVLSARYAAAPGKLFDRRIYEHRGRVVGAATVSAAYPGDPAVIPSGGELNGRADAVGYVVAGAGFLPGDEAVVVPDAGPATCDTLVVCSGAPAAGCVGSNGSAPVAGEVVDDTRAVLAQCLDICADAGARTLAPVQFGVARM